MNLLLAGLKLIEGAALNPFAASFANDLREADSGGAPISTDALWNIVREAQATCAKAVEFHDSPRAGG
jgi:hypothetical protein